MTDCAVELAVLTPAEMGAVRRSLHEQYAITPLQQIENAGRVLALLAARWLDDDLVDRPLVVLAGRGGNGAIGLAAARHLLKWGAWVQMVLAHSPATYEGEAGQQLAALRAVDAPIAWAEDGWELPPADLMIDALVGGGLRGVPAASLRDLIRLANSSIAPVISVDAPSGLDLASGALAEPHVRATATLVLVLPQVGVTQEPGRGACGQLYLADIGAPPQVDTELGRVVLPRFVHSPLLPFDAANGRAWLISTQDGAP
jgi:NAD(P)H-hydrate epimerase